MVVGEVRFAGALARACRPTPKGSPRRLPDDVRSRDPGCEQAPCRNALIVTRRVTCGISDRCSGSRSGRGPCRPQIFSPAGAYPRQNQPPTAWAPPSTWTISPVVAGNQSDSSATQARAAARCRSMSQPSGARLGPHVVEAFEAGDALGRHGGSGPAATRLTRMPSRPEVSGQVAGAGLQAGLGHAHPVVGGPGLARRRSPGRRRTPPSLISGSAAIERLQRVGGDVHRRSPRPPTAC